MLSPWILFATWYLRKFRMFLRLSTTFHMGWCWICLWWCWDICCRRCNFFLWLPCSPIFTFWLKFYQLLIYFLLRTIFIKRINSGITTHILIWPNFFLFHCFYFLSFFLFRSELPFLSSHHPLIFNLCSLLNCFFFNLFFQLH
jgi:hypothetical protein